MLQISCVNENKNVTLQSQKRKMVPWMSGLVNGLQNRLRRFESARDLLRAAMKQFVAALFFIYSGKRLVDVSMRKTERELAVSRNGTVRKLMICNLWQKRKKAGDI